MLTRDYNRQLYGDYSYFIMFNLLINFSCLYCHFRASKFTVGDVFIGYDKDTACSVVLQVSQQLGEDTSHIEVSVEIISLIMGHFCV